MISLSIKYIANWLKFISILRGYDSNIGIVSISPLYTIYRDTIKHSIRSSLSLSLYSDEKHES